MQAALTLLQEKYPHIVILGCIAHLMNLLVGDVLKSRSASQIITNAKSIIKKIEKSHALGALISGLQKEQGIKTSLKLPGKTR